jgi:hypothetical protein
LRATPIRDATSARASGMPAAATSRRIASHVGFGGSVAARRARGPGASAGGVGAARRRMGIDFDKDRSGF